MLGINTLITDKCRNSSSFMDYLKPILERRFSEAGGRPDIYLDVSKYERCHDPFCAPKVKHGHIYAECPSGEDIVVQDA